MTLLDVRTPTNDVTRPAAAGFHPVPVLARKLRTRRTLGGLIEDFILPEGSLPLGEAEDGLPVALDLRRPSAGPLLVLGDAGSGKTGFLRLAAQSAAWCFGPGQLAINVITPHPEGWAGWETLPHMERVTSTFNPALPGFLEGLSSGATGSRLGLLLIDGLDSFAGLTADAWEPLLTILKSGPARGLWPIVTLNAGLAAELSPWLRYFHTRVFGCIANGTAADLLASLSGCPAPCLTESDEFCMASSGQWLKFSLPALS